ncbi:hypothetical protein EZV73_26750 [Acidaminobacter sp. JC074]|uniref:hypothetical protein n=1 Tax=Acidaminobacter sp. JC074 TaxID=2530199 RepID=UPI001F0D126B|nr:hypothetical protein [Acidaminobacter sp. JC074]MCH4891207.1 hypothetical protein [Acidaminobacter sp. JC074]
MNRQLLNWLQRNPQWVLRSEFVKGMIDYKLSMLALANCKRAFITHKGEFYGSLKDVPTFVGVSEVIRVDSIFSDHDLESMKDELTQYESPEIIRELKRTREVAIAKTNDFIKICDLRLSQLEN